MNYSPPLPPDVRKMIDEARAAAASLPPPADTVSPPCRPRWRPGDPATQPNAYDETKRTLAWTNWPLITVGLIQRGYKDSEIQKIIGQNVLRVLEEAGDDVAPPVDLRPNHTNQPCAAI